MSYEVFVNERLKSKSYIHKNEAKKDILNALRAFGDLHPDEDIYVHTDGSRRDLICLKGTIPVNYKGSTYNIPIQIWLLSSHPFNAPLVFVRPTANMLIKPNKHVDNSGKVYMPYLSEWRAQKSDTYSMINMLCMIFAEFCPVYSKPAGQRAPPQQPRPSGYPPGYPAPSGGGGPPGYPTHNAGMPQPNYPMQRPPAYQPANLPSYTPYPSTSTPYPATSGYPQQQQQHHTTTQAPARPPPPATRQESVIKDEHLRLSLLSTAEDKLKRRVKEVFQMGQDELQILETKKSDLSKGNQTLQDMVRRMTDEKGNLDSNVTILEEKNRDLENMLEKLEKDSENMNIDEAVITIAPLYNQILKLFAEENAIEDTMYYLSDALRRGVIESEIFLKTVRDLSRKQFMLRATLQKARATAGLSGNLLGH
ncbi:tumor susceptibility gene 101 protein-like [Clytia hemisphaerica]|uniref:Tumor susceptibility gene 101 protein n=1 Tax=Clytia hemisphaerica TaxID=252671 RepID=A0A7M5UUT9_9CNID